MIEDRVYYFGCPHNDIGHYWLHDNRSMLLRRAERDAMPKPIDGVHAPKGLDQERTLGVMRRTVVTEHMNGKPLETWTIVAWWDRTRDTRPGSNVALVWKGEHTLGEMLDSFEKHYPRGAARTLAQRCEHLPALSEPRAILHCTKCGANLFAWTRGRFLRVVEDDASRGRPMTEEEQEALEG